MVLPSGAVYWNRTSDLGVTNPLLFLAELTRQLVAPNGIEPISFDYQSNALPLSYGADMAVYGTAQTFMNPLP